MGIVAAIIGGVVAAGSAAIGITESIQSSDQSKKAAENAANQQAAANAQLSQSQATASSQAQSALTAKRQAAATSQDVFTSPLGLTTQATVARKTLLGQ